MDLEDGRRLFVREKVELEQEGNDTYIDIIVLVTWKQETSTWIYNLANKIYKQRQISIDSNCHQIWFNINVIYYVTPWCMICL